MDELGVLGQNLRRLRMGKGMTQVELARKVGLTKETVSKIELGKQKNPGVGYLVLICKELDIKMEELFMEEPEARFIKITLSDANARAIGEIFSQVQKILPKKEE